MSVTRFSDAAVDSVLRRIYDENPSHWPYGLSRAHFDGGLYILSKQASTEPVGFVGWQEREEGGRKVGYYSVGVLPEYRRRHYASKAVSAILREKSANVDEVRALIVPSNAPSKALASKLEGVTVVEKSASGKELALRALIGTLGGAATMLLQDNSMHPDEPLGIQAFRVDENDKARNLINLVNFGLGFGGANYALGGLRRVNAARALPSLTERAAETGLGAAQLGTGAAGMLSGPMIKDLVMDSHRAVSGVDRLSKELPDAIRAGFASSQIPKSLIYGGLGVGAAGVGLLGLLSALNLKNDRDKLSESRRGRLKVTLPTKNPNDAETTIELPTDHFDFSSSLQAKLRRDARQRLLGETRGRTRHRLPRDPDNPTEAEKEIIDLDAEQKALDAEMYGKAAAATVPSPPALNVNPAIRMSQEAQAAQQAAQGAATINNPQIMQAQQAASQAEQQAQQQIAESQQQMQQEQMQQEQRMQQELASKDQEVARARQEVEVQKMQAEKAKVEMELAKTKAEAASEIDAQKTDATNNANSAIHKMTKQRLERIRRIAAKASSKSASVPGSFGPGAVYAQHPAQPANMKTLAPHVAQKINDYGGEYQARGGFSPTHLYRTSYGKLGDFLFESFARPQLLSPTSKDNTNSWAGMTSNVMMANPDAYDSLMRWGRQEMYEPRY